MNRGWQQLQERLLSTATIIRRGNTFARQPNIWLWALAFLHIHALMPRERRAGYAICRTADLTAWEYVPDHRGETVYNTETREAAEITTPGITLKTQPLSPR